MARRFLAAITLFVVLWTSTLLHDIAEPDEYLALQPASRTGALTTASLNSPERACSEGHCHDALIVSRFDQPDVHLQCPNVLKLAHNEFWCTSSHILDARLSTRGPPVKIAFAKTKLYLFKRSLLI